MQINNIKNWSRFSKRQQYGLSTLGILLIFFVQDVLFPILADYYPYAIFRFFSIVIAIEFGFYPAMYALVVGSILGNYYFVPPRGEFTLPGEKDMLDWIVLFGATVLICYLVELFQRERYKSELLLKISESRYLSLLHRENHRMILSRKLQKPE